MKTTTFEHRFSIGEKVYYLDSKQQCKSLIIKAISPHIYENKTHLFYYGDDDFKSFMEEQLYATESEMKDHIFGNLIDFV